MDGDYELWMNVCKIFVCITVKNHEEKDIVKLMFTRQIRPLAIMYVNTKTVSSENILK